MTAQTLIQRILITIGALNQGETPSNSDAQSLLITINNMLATWETERLNVYQILLTVFPLVNATKSYTIGPTGAAVTASRPIKLVSANVLYSNPLGSGLLHGPPMKLLSEAEYVGKVDREVATSPLPSELYDDYGFPNSSLFVYPVPAFTAGTLQLQLGAFSPLPNFPDLVTDIQFPPGYIEAIQYNAAVRASPDFDMSVTPEISLLAREAKTSIRALNKSIPDLQTGGAPFAAFATPATQMIQGPNGPMEVPIQTAQQE